MLQINRYVINAFIHCMYGAVMMQAFFTQLVDDITPHAMNSKGIAIVVVCISHVCDTWRCIYQLRASSYLHNIQ